MTRAQRHTTAGSSPLTRGKRDRSQLLGRPPGLIPAHAGKTPSMVASIVSLRAHPRSRGENNTGSRAAHRRAGSSPLTRGKLKRPLRRGRQSGLIPAHAGKTRATSSAPSVCWAHPRSRGENALSPRFPVSTPGSSPLTRGKLCTSVGRGVTSWLIPAHAGKTGDDSGALPRVRAHPRSRGENSACRRANSRCSGSSPLTRGKPKKAAAKKEPEGLIPAHAGKT